MRRFLFSPSGSPTARRTARAWNGTGSAGPRGHFLRRWLALIGIGAIISTGEVLVGKNASPISWGVLQAIGVAGIVTLLVIGVPPLGRALIGLAVLAAYQVLLDSSWLQTVLHSEHGGMEGALSWSAMLILSTVIADAWKRSRVSEAGVAWPSAVALAAGLLLSLVAPISKNRVSASYVLVSLGASGLLFAVVLLIVNRLRLSAGYLRWWGINPLLLYIMHYLLLALVVLPDAPWWHVQASIPLVIAQAAVIIAILSRGGLAPFPQEAAVLPVRGRLLALQMLSQPCQDEADDRVPVQGRYCSSWRLPSHTLSVTSPLSF